MECPLPEDYETRGNCMHCGIAIDECPIYWSNGYEEISAGEVGEMEYPSVLVGEHTEMERML